MIDSGVLLRFASWLVPVPFMVLYHVRAVALPRWVRVVPWAVLGMVLVPVLAAYVDLGFQTLLLMFYLLMVGIAYELFRTKHHPLRALSIAVCLTFFASLYWELPYHAFTILHRGVDQAFALHVLYLFPGMFMFQKIRVPVDKFTLVLVWYGMLVSVLSVFYLMSIGSDFFDTYSNPPIIQYTTEAVWLVVRAACFITLYAIFYRGVPRRRTSPSATT